MHIAAFLQDLAGGGAERVVVLLLNTLARDHRVSLVLARAEGPYLADLDPSVEVHDLGGRRTFAAIAPLARWLRTARPDVLMSHLTHVNVAAAIAIRLAGGRVPLVAVEHNQMDLNFALIRTRSVRLAYRATRLVYPGVARIVCVSDGVARSVRRFARVRGGNIVTIANPVVTPQLHALAAEPAAHPWLADQPPPVILGCGRLVEQKDFATLIRAFATLREGRPARLVILGEGPLRAPLERLAADLGIAADVALPGFDRNPFAAMRGAAVFVLSSRWEGLPTVLIEALATGVPVVSTDCPSGPDEVLQGGALGPLVPVGDPSALAAAIGSALDAPVASDLRRSRAADFTVERASAAYEALFREIARA